LARSQALVSQVAIFGAGAAAGGREAFRDYLRRHGRRRPEWVSVYDPLGLVDTIDAKSPRFHFSEEVGLETVDTLQELRQRGVTFDYYVVDHGWQDTASDLTWFKPEDFPAGPNRLIDAVERTGSRFGLWFPTTFAPWSCGDYLPVQDCFVPNGLTPPRRRRDLCPAAEPYRSVLTRAVLHHLRHHRVRAVKFDMARWYCNASTHDHLPGKYSVEAQIDAMVALAREMLRASPDLFVFWYWGFSSPFWLLYGDTVFDKGLRMEAAAVASAPHPRYRSSVNQNLDQAARHAEFLPLTGQDSLGVWIGDVRWANYMGKEGWREAWLLDLARGSLLSQLWGDLASFDEDDRAFLAQWYDYLRDHWRLYLQTRPILGDPWRGDVYGYAAAGNGRAVVTVVNPGFRAAVAAIDVYDTLGLERGGELVARRLYPDRGTMANALRGGENGKVELVLALRPFDVVALELVRDLEGEAWPDVPSPRVVESVRLEVPPAGEPAPGSSYSGSIRLPSLDGTPHVALAVRLRRGRAYWYHRSIHTLVRLRVTSNGDTLLFRTVPDRLLNNGPGSPWILFDIPVEPEWAGRDLRVDLSWQLPPGVDGEVEAWLYDHWWS
jgi:hypothetical protein